MQRARTLGHGTLAWYLRYEWLGWLLGTIPMSLMAMCAAGVSVLHGRWHEARVRMSLAAFTLVVPAVLVLGLATPLLVANSWLAALAAIYAVAFSFALYCTSSVMATNAWIDRVG